MVAGIFLPADEIHQPRNRRRGLTYSLCQNCAKHPDARDRVEDRMRQLRILCPVCGCVLDGLRECPDCHSCTLCGSDQGRYCPCWSKPE